MNKLYLCTLPKHGKIRCDFTCPKCRTKSRLITGLGRYGNLGRFDCPDCGTEYYATIDDTPNPNIYINFNGQQPAGYLDANKTPLLTLKPTEIK